MAATRPGISVIVPVRDMAPFIGTAISSLLAQELEDWECLVVDDGSIDGSGEVASQFKDSRVSCVRLPRNQGRGSARQTALASCRGDFVGMLDADDWWYPWKLSVQMEFFRIHPHVGALSSSMISVSRVGDLEGVWRVTNPGSSSIHEPLRSLSHLRFPHGPALIRRELTHGGYRTNLRRSEDRAFLANTLSATQYGVLGDPLYVYRNHGEPSVKKLWSRYLWRAVSDLGLFRQYPLSASMALGKSTLQIAATPLLGILGLQRFVSLGRPLPPTAEEERRFRQACERVSDSCRRVAGHRDSRAFGDLIGSVPGGGEQMDDGH